MKYITQQDEAYIRERYRALHRIPEIGFQLPKTVASVKAELDQMGILYTERFGAGSIVAVLNPDGQGKPVALRADMDALPVEEAADVPFRSEHPGIMHACGHDAHTAMLLGAARVLKRMEKDLARPVKLLFQPSEEGAVSGAAMMVERGCMEDVGMALCLHVEPALPTGNIGIFSGPYMAACHPYTITFTGRSAHATTPEKAIDPLAMAVKVYNAIAEMKRTEWSSLPQHILTVSSLRAGCVHNVIPGHAELLISFRFYDMLTHDIIDAQIKKICTEAAREAGGSIAFDDRISCPAVINDPRVAAIAAQAAEKVAGKAHVVSVPRRYSSEDFSHYLTKAPGALIRIGMGNEEKGCGAVCHNSNFKVDEDALKIGSELLVQFILECKELG